VVKKLTAEDRKGLQEEPAEKRTAELNQKVDLLCGSLPFLCGSLRLRMFAADYSL